MRRSGVFEAPAPMNPRRPGLAWSQRAGFYSRLPTGAGGTAGNKSTGLVSPVSGGCPSARGHNLPARRFDRMLTFLLLLLVLAALGGGGACLAIRIRALQAILDALWRRSSSPRGRN